MFKIYLFMARFLCFIGTATVSSSKFSTALPTLLLIFGNGNIMTKAHPIIKLNKSALKSALMVLKTCHSQINLHQATMTAITVMPGSIAAYSIKPWNNTQASRPRKDEKDSLADGASCPTSNATFTPKQHNGGKCNPTTPDTNKDNPSDHQRQKKPRCGEKG
jgi:hypothetical protein